jgi:steroid delta-isomerase-like uncharacterized protein
MSAVENKAMVRRVYDEIINQGNLNVADQIFASDYVYRSPGSPELRGPEGFKELIAGYRGAFPDLHMTIDELIAEGDAVASRWTASGTHRGELMGIPPSGKQVTISGLIITRFAGGKATDDFEIFDTMGLLQQIGAMPAPEPAVATVA